MKYLMRFLIVAALCVVASQEPPRQTNAEDVNKQQQVAVEQKANPVQPPVTQQAEAKPVVVAQPPAPDPQSVVPAGCEAYRQIISKYNWNVTTMMEVMRAESSCNPNNIGDQRVINGLYAPSCGLFQIRTLAGRPTCEQLKDPETNVAWAYKIYLGQGFNAWSVCKTKVSCY